MVIKLIIVLFLLLIIVGGDRGVRSCVTLILNVLIGIGSIYLISFGMSPLLVMVAASLLFCLFTIFYQNEFNVKTLAVFLSVASVVFVTSILIFYIGFHAHIAGLNEIEMQEEDVSYLSAAVHFRMLYVLIAAMVWGQLGAIVDTSIAISSSLHEIHHHNSSLSVRKLFQEGCFIGKDILGTTINTLFFVSMGESIMLFLYYMNYQYSLQKILNSSSFFQTVFPVLLPCMGCILIIPLTALVFSLLVKNPKVSAYFEKKNTAGKTA